jgi:hypothetical protein
MQLQQLDMHVHRISQLRMCTPDGSQFGDFPRFGAGRTSRTCGIGHLRDHTALDREVEGGHFGRT